MLGLARYAGYRQLSSLEAVLLASGIRSQGVDVFVETSLGQVLLVHGLFLEDVFNVSYNLTGTAARILVDIDSPSMKWLGGSEVVCQLSRFHCPIGIGYQGFRSVKYFQVLLSHVELVGENCPENYLITHWGGQASLVVVTCIDP